jgi:NAD(P)-dependent dehydrogenase (short-subunit alcohol dehydrogenase family)
MQEFRDRVAVVTGAGSGIGRALAEQFAAEGMKVVLADVQDDALVAVEAELRRRDTPVLAVRTDVRHGAAVEALAEAAFDTFGAVDVLCNNAGVAGGGGRRTWEASENDWRWTLDVNLWGVIHGVRAFVPRMLAQGTDGAVVNTASVLGLSSGPGGGPYGVSKHGVVRLSEGLHYDFVEVGAQLQAHVLCPGLINTEIVLSGRNRPDDLSDAADEAARQQAAERSRVTRAYFAEHGMPPARVAEIVLDALRANRFYILTHPDGIKQRVRTRMEDILAERTPSPPPARTMPS